MVPITHVLYLAFGLLFIGLCGLLFVRRVVALWISIELLVLATALLSVAFSRHWGNLEGQVFAVVILLIGTAITAIGGTLSARVVEQASPEVASLDRGEA